MDSFLENIQTELKGVRSPRNISLESPKRSLSLSKSSLLSPRSKINGSSIENKSIRPENAANSYENNNNSWICSNPRHNGETLISYCLKRSCTHAGFACLHCLSEHHRLHLEYVPSLQDAIDMCKEHRRDILPVLEGELLQLYSEKLATQSQSVIDRMRRDRTILIQQIEGVYDEMERLVEREREALAFDLECVRLNSNFREIIELFSGEETYVRDEESKHLIRYLTTLLDVSESPVNNNSHEFSKSTSEIKKSMNEKENSNSNDPSAKDHLMFAPQTEYNKIVLRAKELDLEENAFSSLFYDTSAEFREEILSKILILREAVVGELESQPPGTDGSTLAVASALRGEYIQITGNRSVENALEPSQPRLLKTEFYEVLQYLDVNAISFRVEQDVYLCGFYCYKIAPTSQIKKAAMEVRLIAGRKVVGHCLVRVNATLSMANEAALSNTSASTSAANFLEAIKFPLGIRLVAHRIYTLALIHTTPDSVPHAETATLGTTAKFFYGSQPAAEGALFSYINSDYSDIERAISAGDYCARVGNTDVQQGQINSLIYLKADDPSIRPSMITHAQVHTTDKSQVLLAEGDEFFEGLPRQNTTMCEEECSVW